MIQRITPEIWSKINQYASFPQTGVSLKQMVEFGRNPSVGTILRASQFLQDQLPIRLAKRVVDLHDLPDGLSSMPSIVTVKNWYAESFMDLIKFPKLSISNEIKEKYRIGIGEDGQRFYSPFDSNDLHLLPPETAFYNENFAKLIESLVRRHDPVLTTMAFGIIEWKNAVNKSGINSEIQLFLDRFNMSRIGIRVLCGQHIALQNNVSPNDFVGIICTNTNVKAICQDAIENARFVCEDHFGLFEAPEIKVQCPVDVHFTYVPSHLHHMLFELLKNSLRAVVEFYGVDAPSYPPIQVVVAIGKEDFSIKISDEGGGIPRSALPMIFTYMYTTAKTPPFLDPNFQQPDYKAPMAGFGYGLPLSRLVKHYSLKQLQYARYFGGDLKIISLEGHGTDAYVHLCRFSDMEEPLQ